ncbi:DUF3575 domain-containing protein [Reichenbachiella ulvae]|uniref:DUF3575 domain-containing protein n=1 Tax=Reichenbachiella ulvae TaxID=2980104 RepID=A0ABT3CUL5_9BACT|nr:DUF3575 domain-containing protein [Reichenbachiella ulvae]MCV9387271.1 DUF3575 domain-containing protein [Reichenbachiella ulvae]
MKRILLLILFITYSLVSKAQNTEYNSMIKFETVHGGLHFTQKIKDRSSISIIVNYDLRYLINPNYYDLQISPEYRFHLSKKNAWPRGFYIGTYLFFKDFVVARPIEQNNIMIDSKDEIVTAGIGIKPGYQLTFPASGRWVIDWGLGFGYNIYRDVNNVEGVPIINEDSYDVNFSANIAVGYVFSR